VGKRKAKKEEEACPCSSSQNKISLLLTSEEMAVLEEMSIFEPCLVGPIETAKAEEGKHRVKFYAEDLEDALEALSYNVDCADSEQKEVMRDLIKTIQRCLSIN